MFLCSCCTVKVQASDSTCTGNKTVKLQLQTIDDLLFCNSCLMLMNVTISFLRSFAFCIFIWLIGLNYCTVNQQIMCLFCSPNDYKKAHSIHFFLHSLSLSFASIENAQMFAVKQRDYVQQQHFILVASISQPIFYSYL